MAGVDMSMAATLLRRLPWQYIQIARPDHWTKNVFALPGTAAALALTPTSEPLWKMPLALISLCLIASANYSINDLLDLQCDRFHPVKNQRPGPRGLLDRRLVLLQYVLLAAIGIGLSATINLPFLLTSISLLVTGLIYNVPPLRAKNYAYLDVLVESVNNPIRFLFGWFAVSPDFLPPSSVLLAYWMGGAFLMGTKRYSEFRCIGNPQRATRYRSAFARYTEHSLLLSAFFYALCSAFFGAIFLIKYKIELVLTFPLLAAVFTWYLSIALKRDSAAQAPEKLYREVKFMIFASFVFASVAFIFYINIPLLHVLMNTNLIGITR